MSEFKWDSVEEYASELVLKSIQHHWPKLEIKVAANEVAGVKVFDAAALKDLKTKFEDFLSNMKQIKECSVGEKYAD
jgi:hypothetical protein